MCPGKPDAIVVGTGIAGLGVAAQLATRGLKVICYEQAREAGGRLGSFTYRDGWSVDIGLHMTELGELGAANELCRSVGGVVNWPPFSESVLFFEQGSWKDVAELVQMSKADRKDFKDLMGRIASLPDEAIESVDDLSWKEWMDRQQLPQSLQHLFSLLSMVMTTLPDPSEQSAGEVLFISRENLQKKRQILSANYPLGGMRALVQPLVDAIQSQGGEIVLNCKVQEVIVDKGAVRGVRIPKRDSSAPYPLAFRVEETKPSIRIPSSAPSPPTSCTTCSICTHPEPPSRPGGSAGFGIRQKRPPDSSDTSLA